MQSICASNFHTKNTAENVASENVRQNKTDEKKLFWQWVQSLWRCNKVGKGKQMLKFLLARTWEPVDRCKSWRFRARLVWTANYREKAAITENTVNFCLFVEAVNNCLAFYQSLINKLLPNFSQKLLINLKTINKQCIFRIITVLIK